MLKINLIYPIIIITNGEKIELQSKEFNLSVQSDNVLDGITRIKKMILFEAVEISKAKGKPPMPTLDIGEDKNIYFVELDPGLFKNLCERVNMSIPANLLGIIDLWGINRSNYVTDLITQDIMKKGKFN